jgi:hypothetical protein
VRLRRIDLDMPRQLAIGMPVTIVRNAAFAGVLTIYGTGAVAGTTSLVCAGGGFI